MEADTQRMRPAHADRCPYVLTHLHWGDGLDTVVRFIEQRGLLTT
jgi:urease accessory protein